MYLRPPERKKLAPKSERKKRKPSETDRIQDEKAEGLLLQIRRLPRSAHGGSRLNEGGSLSSLLSQTLDLRKRGKEVAPPPLEP